MDICITHRHEAPLELLAHADPSGPRIQKSLERGILYIGNIENGMQKIAVAIVNEVRHELEITHIAVDPEYQGRGYGKQMLEFILNESAKQGYDRINVGTGNSSLDQLAFYQKCGFRITGVLRDYFREDCPPIFENGIRCLDMIMLSCLTQTRT